MKQLHTVPNLLVSIALCLQAGCTADDAATAPERALPPAGLLDRIESQVATALNEDPGCEYSQVQMEEDGGFVHVTGKVSGWDCRRRVEDALRSTQGLRGYVLNVAATSRVPNEENPPEMDLDQGDMTRAASKVVRAM